MYKKNKAEKFVDIEIRHPRFFSPSQKSQKKENRSGQQPLRSPPSDVGREKSENKSKDYPGSFEGSRIRTGGPGGWN